MDKEDQLISIEEAKEAMRAVGLDAMNAASKKSDVKFSYEKHPGLYTVSEISVCALMEYIFKQNPSLLDENMIKGTLDLIRMNNQSVFQLLEDQIDNHRLKTFEVLVEVEKLKTQLTEANSRLSDMADSLIDANAEIQQLKQKKDK